MPTVPHLDPPADTSLPDAPDGADMNLLAAEWDRKMGLCLDGLSPLLGELQILNAYGCAAGDGDLIGTKYGFTGTDAPIIYLLGQPTYDHRGFHDAAAAATETSRDLAAGIMVATPVDAGLDGVGVYDMEWSLECHTRYDATDDFIYALAFDLRGITAVSPARPHRPHRYAVAELLLEGLSTFVIPWTTGGERWDRYQCFRVHNFSGISVDVTVENSASSGDDITYTIPPYGCLAIRRHPEENTCTAPYRYLWQWRASTGRPRFWRTGGSWFPELSSSANNLGNPAAVLLGWSAALGWEHDPGVDRDISPRFPGLFGDVSSTSTKLGDLLHHQGTFWHVTWSGTTPVLASGSFTGHANLVSDMAAAGITATIDGAGVITLASASTDDAVMALGTNLMLLPSATWGALTVDDGCRAYRPLPVTLPNAMLSGAAFNVTTTIGSASVTRSWDDGTPHTASASYDTEAADTSGIPTSWALGTTIATVNSTFSADEPADGSFSLAWNFGPQGVELIGSFTRRIRNPGSDAFLGNWAGGEDYTLKLYDSVEDDATATIAIRLVLCPYSFGNGWPTDIAGTGGTDPTHTALAVNSLTPLRPRYYGNAPDIGSAVTETDDFGTRYGLTDPVKQTRTVTTRADLTRLQAVSATSPDSVRAQSYFLFPDDEGQAAYDALTLSVGGAYTNRLRFAAGRGAPYAAFDPLRYLRAPLDAVAYNHLAWQINSVTRCRPFYDFGDFYIGIDADGIPFRLEQEHAGPLGIGIWPAAQYTRIDTGGIDILATSVAALGIPVLDLDDTPGGTAAAAAAAAQDWTEWRHRTKRFYTAYVDNETAPGSGVYVRTTTFHDEPYSIAVETTGAGDPVHDYDVYSDPDYLWVSADDVATYAASLGLPFRHRAFGVALKLEVIATQTPTAIGDSASPDDTVDSAPFFAGSPPTPLADGIAYGLESNPSAWVRFMPALTTGDIGWLAETETSGWFSVADAWRLDRRQVDIANGVTAPTTESGDTTPGSVGSTLDAAWAYAQTDALRSREFHEEQTLGCLWTLMPDDVNQTRLICLPYPAEEATVDANLATLAGNTPPDPNGTVPWTVTAADPDDSKAEDFSAASNLFRPGVHEAWKTRLVSQTYISLA